MGIKDLFNENSTGVVPTTSIEEEVVRNTPELESVENIREQRERIERYIPPLDFNDPKSFARYGSAESYYQDAISRIYNQYPYDGSEREIQEFLNESNYVDLHMYENEYPRTTGYAIFSADGWGTISSPGTALTGGYGLSDSVEYIKVIGGPHTSSGGIPTGELRKAFGEPINRTSPNANIYDNDIYGTAEVDTLGRVGSRESNLKFDLSNGVSTEFWFNKGEAGCENETVATATFTFGDAEFDDTNDASITLVDTTGVSRTYVIKNDYGASAALEFNAGGSRTAAAANFIALVNGANGHNGTITAAHPGDGVITLTQTAFGAIGNTTITNSNWDSICDVNVGSAFTGGTGASICHTKQVIFDLWNGEASSSAGYGRLLVGYTGSLDGTSPLYAHIASGSNVWDMTFGGSTTTTSSLEGTWNHIGFTFSTSSADARLETKFYLNGDLKETQTNTSLSSFGEVTGSLIGFIGALQTAPSGNAFFDGTSAPLDMAGYGKLSGSIDEFRFWKNKRTERDIQRNWWTQVRGGTNTDISNADLGFYFKFNEGITGDASTDATVLDYSGRISNGMWIGYPSSNARNVGSAINLSTATVTGTAEFKDPIIYSDHADVVSLYDSYTTTGSAHDHANVSSILDSLPSWIVEEDEAKGSGELKKLAQIVGSYFDTLHLQVEHLPKIAEVGYQTASAKPVPFSERLLASFGLHAPETFVEASILEKFANRRDDREYSLDINDVKNQVYQNIYNNLNFIYKSKGTEKSFRNLIRCYGIDEEVIRLNAYGNNSTFKFEDTYSDATVRKNYIDFNHPDRFDGIVYQRPSSNSETTGISYISGTNANFANTAEAEIIFPKKMEISNKQYFLTPFISASLFGAHTAKSDASDFDWESSGNDYGFQTYFVKTAEESKDGHFVLTNRAGTLNLASSVFADVYDNQKWNLAVRVKDGKYPYASGVTGSNDSNNVTVEFVGYNIELGVTRNEFSVSATGLSDSYLTTPRRYYAGADRTDTVGAVVTKTDVRISSVRHYAHYLEDSALLAHAKDPTNFGVGRANKNIIFSANDAGIEIDNIDLPEYASLAFHWDFSQVTGSDAAGAFQVNDASSGSVSLQTRYSPDGNFSYIVANQYSGRGYFPSALSSASIVDKNYVPASVHRLPEVVNSNDAVNVLTQDDDLYPSDPAVSQTFFAFEKSMFGVISQEMINTMATIIEFNNLVGEMTNKYRGDYKDFTRLRNLFFEKIENDPDLDKFIDYYKWIDNSLSVMIQQLVPASADVADEIRTIVESHIFERSKYRHKMPLLDYKGNARWGGDELLLEARAFGANELAYNWKHGHAPIFKKAAATFTFGDAEFDDTNDATITLIDTSGTSKTYKIKNDYGASAATEFNAGANVGAASANFIALVNGSNGHNGTIVAAHLGDGVITLTQAASGDIGNTVISTSNWDSICDVNVGAAFTGGQGAQNLNALWWKERAERDQTKFGTTATIDAARQTISDVILSFNSASYKGKFSTTAGTNYDGSTYALRRFASPVRMSMDLGGSDKVIKSGYNFPRTQKPESITRILKPGSTANLQVTTGDFKDINIEETGDPILTVKRPFITETSKNSKIHSPVGQFSSSLGTTEFGGLHTDAYGDHYETPMQGPFSQEHVGGYQHRHTALNTGADSVTNRQEAWEIAGGDTFTTRSSMEHPVAYSSYQRDERVKRPVNLRNIQSVTGTATLGNYQNIYEVVQTSGRKGNNSEFVKNEGFGSSSVVSSFLEDANDYAKPARTKRAHVFVNRFSAPGGPETAGDANGGPFLDLESAEYSPYNDMNSRNSTVRKPLQTLLTEHNEQFGFRSGSSTIGAIHKTNKNAIKRLEHTDAENTFAAIATASSFDNYYVQHMIPQSDYQYTWVTASYASSDGDVFGYFPADGLKRTGAEQKATATFTFGDAEFDDTNDASITLVDAAGTSKTYVIKNDYGASATLEFNAGASANAAAANFIALVNGSSGHNGTIVATNASGLITLTQATVGTVGNTVISTSNWDSICDVNVGSKFAGGGFADVLTSAVSFISASDTQAPNGTLPARIDFAGLNTGIFEPVNPLEFTVGYSLEVPYSTYRNGLNNDAAVLNAISAHRNGPHGHPTFRQIRVGQSALGRHYRNNNLYTHTPFGGDELKTNFANAVQTIPSRRGNTLIVSQSVVTSKYHPIKQELLVVTGEGRGKAVVRPLMIMSSYANNVVYFDNPDFANKMGIKIKKGFSAYNQIKNLYLDEALEDLSSPVVGINRVLYTETVWPSLENAYTNKVRGRTEFTNNFWRDSRTDRTALAATKKPKNTAGLEIAQSAWSLDAPEDMLTRVAVDGPAKLNTGGTASAASAGHKAGELQNEYVHYHGKDATKVFAGALYARKHIFPNTSSIAPSWGVHRPSAEIVGDPVNTKYLHSASLFRGEALWEAGANAGYIQDIDSQFSTKPVNPFYDSYDEYFANIKGAVKDYSIIPEFRIEDHLSFFRANGGDYLTENTNMLRIPQASSSLGAPQNSTEDDFFKIYTNSDFLKYFEVIRDDHSELINPHAISLKCKAMKKFVPYDGFYPAERTTELVKQFMLSYGENVSFVRGDDDLDSFDQNMRNFIKPLFAPGILFNTIKSGLAVDYPIMTSSFNRDKAVVVANYPAAQTASFSIYSSSRATSSAGNDHSAGWDKRIPFEALISPEKYIANFSINDDEPSDFCRVDSTVNWTGEGDSIYRQMMNNFLAESVNFFIKDGKTTGISSLPQEQFKYVTPGKAYGMRIKLWRSMDRGKITSGSYGSFRLPQNTIDEIKAGTNSTTTNNLGQTVAVAGLGLGTEATASETFTMYSRPSAFGPALGLEKSANANFEGSIYDFSAQNGVYASHTPPYYDGESWVDLIYFPEGLEAMSGDLDAGGNDPSFFQMRTDLPTLSAYQPKIEEIFATPSPEIFDTDNSSVPLVGTFTRKWRFDQEELKRSATSTYNKTGANYGPAAGPWVDRWAMQADATLNLFDVVAGESDTENKWRIQTKFETPMLNFKDVSVANDTLTLTSDSNANAAIPRGMWHQFGKLPKEGEGVYLQVTDIPTNWLSTHPSATLKWDITGHHSLANLSPRLQSSNTTPTDEANAYYGGYSLPLSTIGAQSSLEDIVPIEIGSLIDVCGFNTDPVRIGDIASSSEISEAIVAVPFMEKGAEREFFTIPSPDSAQFSSLAGRSMSDQINLMQKYVFPPSLDFLENPEVTPVAMYIFEFKHRFSKQELSHMWQNLPPKIGTEPVEATSTITHTLLANELMGDWNSLVATQTSETPGGEMSFTPLEKVKWMVFKVKQKALSNYYDVLEGKEAEANALDANKDKYTNNWPYDFCSIVELAKMDVEVEFGEKEISATEARLALRGERAKGVVLSRDTGATAAAPTGTPDDGQIRSSLTGLTGDETAALTAEEKAAAEAAGQEAQQGVGTSPPPSYGDN